ncbi:MAG: hypothetical protein HYS40_09095 [Gemmatimonadetes bacterium]|nr:hypothetical protein [Gemmatimonadota bacterium]
MPRLRVGLLLPLVFLIARPPGCLFAQAPAERAALDALRDSLAGVTDSVALKRLEAATIALARADQDNPLLHLRLGFIGYRLGELANSQGHYDDAAGEFEWATELRADWPYPWYGLGLAELALGEHRVIAIENLRQILGKDYLSKAARAFARATEAEPSFSAAVVDLANAALAQRIRPRLEVALQAVRLATASPAGRYPDVQLARGRVEREAGEVDSALAAFRAALAVGADSGVGMLELARTLYHARRPAEGWTSYFAGARAAASPAALALYRADLGWAAAPDDLAAFDSLGAPAARAVWLEWFWSRRDIADARVEGERLAEHYRRWFHAHSKFRLMSRHRHYDITERYRAEQSELDDRGVIYLRHGDPDRRARYTAVGVEPNESWLYRRPDRDLIFHFVARDDVTDYKLVESLVDVLGFSAGVRAAGGTNPQVAELYASRHDFGPLYDRVGAAGARTGSALAEERDRGQRAITTGTTSDSYHRRFEAPFDVVATDFVVGASADSLGGQALHVVFAIPARRLAPQRTGDGVAYPLRFRIVVSDAQDRLVGRIDTMRVFGRRQPLPDGTHLTGRVTLPVPPGRYRYRLLVTTADGGAGDLVLQDSVEVPTLDGRAFAASDLVVGRQGSGLVWALPRDTVLLNPLGRFPEGSAAELYYEVYGLPRGAAYHTVVELAREGGRSVFGTIRGLFGGRRAPVLLEFDAPADGPVTRVHRAITLRGVPSGTYRLSVRMTDPASHRTLVRTRRFQVVSR